MSFLCRYIFIFFNMSNFLFISHVFTVYHVASLVIVSGGGGDSPMFWFVYSD